MQIKMNLTLPQIKHQRHFSHQSIAIHPNLPILKERVYFNCSNIRRQHLRPWTEVNLSKKCSNNVTCVDF